MHNDPVPKTYFSKRLSPSNAKLMELFDNMEGKHHPFSMYNIYKSVAFFKTASNNKKNLLTRGVTVNVIRGIAPCCIQY